MSTKPRKFRSLAVTFAVSFSALIMLALLIAGSLQMYFSFQAQQKILLENQKLIARNTANTVGNFIRDKFNILAAASLRKNLVILPKEEQETTLDRFMGLEPAFRQLAVFNKQYQEIARISRVALESFQLMHFSREELFRRASRKENYIGPVYIDEATNEPMVILAVPVTDVFGNYQGALIAETNLKFMWDLMGQIKIGKNGQAYVVESQGYLIACRDISRVLKRENLSYLKPVKNFIQQKAFTEMTAEISAGILNTRVITSQVHLQTPNWAVIVELPMMEAYRPIVTTLILSVVVMLLNIVIAILSGVYLSRRLTKPIIELRDAAEKIGKGHLSLTIDPHANNEIGDLAESFNTMVKDLENTTVSKNALIKEINERMQVEQILMESEQKMKAILRASPIGIGLVNQGKLEWANESLFSITGYEKEVLLGQTMSVLYADEKEYARVRKELLSSSSSSRAGQVETQWVRADKAMLDCVVGSCPLDSADPSKGQIITVIDISEAKRLNLKLLHAQKMEVLGTLAAGVAHDLNNILGAIVGYPELLLMEMPENHPQREPLSAIKKAGDKAAAIVQDLLTLARRGVAIKEVVNLNTIVTEFQQSPEYAAILAFHPKVKVETDLDANLLHTMGMPFNLSKVLMNLVSNAAEAMADGGSIRISTRNRHLDQPVSGYETIDKGEYVVLSVTDTGVSVFPEDLARLFEPFYTKKKMGRSGTGLGMTVVWGVVKDLNGYIDVSSEENKKTTFDLYFPANRNEVIEKKSSSPVDVYKAKGESVLVVDDVEEQRMILSRMLKKLGYRVAVVLSGEEAVEYMQNNTVNLLVLDMIMDPGINGLETYKRILKFHPCQKAIVTTGFSETEHVQETLRLGAGAYVKKPYSFQQIGRTVREELDK